MASSRSRSQWRKPSLLHKYVKNKAKRGSKTLRKRSTSFSVSIPSVQGGQVDNPPSAAGELHGDTGADMDVDGAYVDSDSDHEPTRCRDL